MTTQIEASKIVTYEVLSQIDERLSKIVTYSVLRSTSIQASKLNTYMILKPLVVSTGQKFLPCGLI